MINLYNLFMIIRILCDKKLRDLLFEMNDYFKEDKNFNLLKFFRTVFVMVRGEKIIKFNDQYILHSFFPPLPSKAAWSNFKATLTDTDKYTQHYDGRRRAPLSTYLSVTNKCPNDCKYCSAKGKKEKELSTDEWKAIIQKFQNLGVAILGFTGGEPMVRKDIVEIVKSVDDRSISFLFTSGVGFTQKKAIELKQAGLFGAGISIPSNPFLEENKKRVEISLKAMEISNKAGLYTTAHIVLVSKDVDKKHLFKVFKLLKKYNVNDIRIFSPIFSGNFSNIDNPEDFLLTEKDKQKYIQIQFKANRWWWRFPKVTSDLYTERGEKMGCNAALLHSYVSTDGELCPCDFFDWKFGNVLTSDLSALWNKMRTTFNSPKCVCVAHNHNIAKLGNTYNKNLKSFCPVNDRPILYKKLMGK